MRLELPYPPSLNSYYRTYKGRMLISAKGREYRKLAVLCIRRVIKEPLTGRVCVNIYSYPPDKRRRDLDNLLKPTLDALEHGGALLNDEQIDDLYIRRLHVIKGGKINIEIEEIK